VSAKASGYRSATAMVCLKASVSAYQSGSVLVMALVLAMALGLATALVWGRE
jgi:hypothetical protein